jgi:formylglycine-generating enzyme required for sulfatase activity
MKQLLSVILMLLFMACSLKFVQSGGISISQVLIEDSDMKDMFSSSSELDTVYASWSNKHIILYYRFKGQSMTYERSYTSEDDYIFKSRTIEGLASQGSVYSLRVKSDISWDEINQTDAQDLIFRISVTTTPNRFRDMVFVRGGWFRMGSKLRKEELPVHTVYVDDFYLDKHEVSVGQYKLFCQATNRDMPRQPSWNYETHPVVNVSWEDA